MLLPPLVPMPVTQVDPMPSLTIQIGLQGATAVVRTPRAAAALVAVVEGPVQVLQAHLQAPVVQARPPALVAVAARHAITVLLTRPYVTTFQIK